MGVWTAPNGCDGSRRRKRDMGFPFVDFARHGRVVAFVFLSGFCEANIAFRGDGVAAPQQTPDGDHGFSGDGRADIYYGTCMAYTQLRGVSID